MKKFLVSLLTLMLALCCAFSVACSMGEEEQTEQGGSQNVYQITESQFASAFVLVDAPFQVVATEGELGGEVYIAEVNYVPGKIYEKETKGTDVDETYYSKEGNNYHKYVKEDGNWIKLDADSYVNVLEFYNPLVFVAEELELNLSFSDLTFNKETNYYDYVKDYGMGISLNLTFKFENARIVYFGVRLGNDVEAEILTMSFTYDNVAVTLPQIGGGESGGNEGNQSAYEVTENQFLEATNSANYSVFMVDGENVIKENGVVNQSQSAIVKYVIVQDGFYTKVPGQEVYFQKSGSEYFGYLQNGSEWQKVPVQESLYEDNRAMILSNASPATMVNGYGIVYTALTFNATENCYVYSPQGENGMSATIKIFFEDGKIVKFYMNAVNVVEQEEVTITMVYTYDNVTLTYPNVDGGNQGGESGGENPEPPVDPNPEPPVDPNPEPQDAYVFKFKSIVIMGKECFVGDTIYSLTITEDFATFILNKDFTVQMITKDMTSNGSWVVFGDAIMVEVTDNEDTYTFVLNYDKDANVVTFKVESYTYKFEVPENLSYQDVIGEVDMQYADLNKIVVGENEFTVGSAVAGIVLTPESAYMKIFFDGKFMFQTVNGYKVYGYWAINQEDYTIILSYEFDEDDYVSKAVTLNNGATICLDLSDFDGLTYYLNVDGIGGGDFGDNEVNPEKPDVELPSTLRIGISPDYEPFAYYENGNLMGFDIELAYAIADLLGYAREDVELITVDLFDQLFLNLEKGEYDIVISGIPSTPEREERFYVSISYVEYFVCYEGDNGQNVEEFEEYHVFSYNNYELIEVINWSIQILLQNGYIDDLVAYWL